MSRRKLVWPLSIIGLFSYAAYALAVDQSSANFQNFDSSFAPAIASQQSTNFQITGGLDAIVGISQSSAFQTVSGVPLPIPIPTPPTPISGGGGGGGGYTPPAATSTTPTSTAPIATSTLPLPTLEYRPWTFRSTGLVKGMRASDTAQVSVNGSGSGVELLAGAHWQKILPLFLGWNQVAVQQSLGSEVSGYVYGLPKRRLIGDVNDDRIVDDVDLSLLTRAWKTFTVDADFNEDVLIDDIDLSLLVAHWGQSY